MARYQLQAFHGDTKVIDTTVAWINDSHPRAGQTINEKWRVVEILDSNTPEVYRVRVELV